VAESFRDFELRGWEDPTICVRYDDYFARLTTRSRRSLRGRSQRNGSTLKAQRPEALTAIRESVREAVAENASGGVRCIPMPAVLATASKPQSVL